MNVSFVSARRGSIDFPYLVASELIVYKSILVAFSRMYGSERGAEPYFEKHRPSAAGSHNTFISVKVAAKSPSSLKQPSAESI
jgi:hypothetical protein